MAVIVEASDPRTLLAEIRKAVRGGTCKPWHCDSDGDFYLAEESPRVWLRAEIDSAKFVLRVLPAQGKHVSKRQYAVYHARFVELLLNHFDRQFQSVAATALPAHGDKVKSATA